MHSIRCSIVAVSFIIVTAPVGVSVGVSQDKSLDFAGQKIVQRYFDGQDLEKANFAGASLSGCGFYRKANLSGVNFRNANLNNVTFSESVLNDSDFTGATYEIGKISNSKLKKTNFQGVDLSTVDIENCDLRGANLSHLKGIRRASACLFNGADLRSADLRDMTWAEGNKPLFDNARYDSKTQWPAGFDPKLAGAKLEKDADPLKDVCRNDSGTKPILPKLVLPKPEKGTRQIEGLYFEIRDDVKERSAVYFFAPAGYVSAFPIGGIDGFDFAKAANDNPGTIGDYVIRGDTMVVRLGSKPPMENGVRFGNEGFEFGKSKFFKARAFTADAKLAGTYEGSDEGRVSITGGTAVTFRTYAFKHDGSFTLEATGATRGGPGLPVVDKGGNLPGAAVTTKSQGTYSLSGNTLILTAKGKTNRMTIFAAEDANHRPLLYIDGLYCKKLR